MQRALNRAYQRIQGNHPRRPPENGGRTLEIVCDVLLASAAAVFAGGLALSAWSVAGELKPYALIGGVALIVLGPLLLLVWERIAWSGFADRLSHLS